MRLGVYCCKSRFKIPCRKLRKLFFRSFPALSRCGQDLPRCRRLTCRFSAFLCRIRGRFFLHRLYPTDFSLRCKPEDSTLSRLSRILSRAQSCCTLFPRQSQERQKSRFCEALQARRSCCRFRRLSRLQLVFRFQRFLRFRQAFCTLLPQPLKMLPDRFPCKFGAEFFLSSL